MNLPSYFSDPQVQNLQQIIEDIQRGGILIPRFQRPFVWTDEQRLTLLQSVREGLPIGSILVWRTTEHKLDTFREIAGTPVPTAYTEGPPWQYLLDGHQRLTTLFGALRSPRQVTTSTAPSPEPELDQNWKIYFDLKKKEFVFKGRGTPPPHWVPTNVLLDSVALLKYQRDLAKAEDGDSLVDAVDRLATDVRNYKIPVIPISSNDLHSVTVAFQRVNSGGTQMSDADMVIALSYDRSLDLRKTLDEASERLIGIGWNLFESKYLLAVVRLRKDLPIASPDAGETSKIIRENPKLIEEATGDVIRAANFLREYCHIGGPNVVPYSYQSVLIAESFRINPNPSSDIIRELRRWLWATSYTGYFLGARDAEVEDALQEIRGISRGNASTFANGRLDIVPLPKRFDFRAARCKALATRLAELNPLNHEGNPFDAIETLASFGPAAFFHLIPQDAVGPEFFSSPENRFLMPPAQVQKDSKWSLRLAFAGRHGADWLRSHALTEEAAKAYDVKNFQEFLRLRRTAIMELEDRFFEDAQLKRIEETDDI